MAVGERRNMLLVRYLAGTVFAWRGVRLALGVGVALVALPLAYASGWCEGRNGTEGGNAAEGRNATEGVPYSAYSSSPTLPANSPFTRHFR